MLDAKKILQDFPQLKQEIYGSKRLVYLDSAASALKPLPVVESLHEFYSLQASNVHRGQHFYSAKATQKYEDARHKVVEFLNAVGPEEIVFTRGTTESINLVAQSFGSLVLKQGEVILLSEMEHHSNIVPWQEIAKRTGAQIKAVPVMENGELDMESLRSMLDEKVKMVSLVMTSNSLGTVNPVKEVIRLAHEVGAKVLVDGAQAVAHEKIDVRELDCDFFTFSGHKLFGPYGIGVLYGKVTLLEEMSPYQTGGSMIDRVTIEKTTYIGSPQKFEAGTPNIAGAIGLAVAIEYVESLGLDNISNHCQNLLLKATEVLKQISGVRVVGEAQHKTSIISFLVADTHPSDVAAIVDHEGVAVRAGHHCCMPLMERLGLKGTIRASFSVYNFEEDVTALAEAIDKSKGFFG